MFKRSLFYVVFVGFKVSSMWWNILWLCPSLCEAGLTDVSVASCVVFIQSLYDRNKSTVQAVFEWKALTQFFDHGEFL